MREEDHGGLAHNTPFRTRERVAAKWLSPRMAKGSRVALAVAAVLLAYLYGIHPELAARGLDPYVSGQTLRGLKAAITFGALGLSLYEARRRLAHDPIPQRIVRRVAGTHTPTTPGSSFTTSSARNTTTSLGTADSMRAPQWRSRNWRPR
jgi:hypothetical protein